MAPFNKPPKRIDEHIQMLKDRGLSFGDEDFAKDFLKHVTYYRLCSYWLPFEVPADGEIGTHKFRAGASFEAVASVYEFDRKLRMLVMDAVERVEISVRSRWANMMKFVYGAHAQLVPAAFVSRVGQWSYQTAIDKWCKDFRNSSETFAGHFKTNHEEKLPPIWAAVELLSLGSFSRWYEFTKMRTHRNTVAKAYGLDEKVLTSYLHHLTVVRNHCAHHARLWNRNFSIPWVIPTKAPTELVESLLGYADPAASKQTYKIYNTLTMLAYLMSQISPDTCWHEKLIALTNEYKVDLAAMGFPAGFSKTPVWS